MQELRYNWRELAGIEPHADLIFTLPVFPLRKCHGLTIPLVWSDTGQKSHGFT